LEGNFIRGNVNSLHFSSPFFNPLLLHWHPLPFLTGLIPPPPPHRHFPLPPPHPPPRHPQQSRN
jgi:hypothetical protein